MKSHRSLFLALAVLIAAALAGQANAQQVSRSGVASDGLAAGDPASVASFNFFHKVSPGSHVVEAMVATGRNPDIAHEPTVLSPMLARELVPRLSDIG